MADETGIINHSGSPSAGSETNGNSDGNKNGNSNGNENGSDNAGNSGSSIFGKYANSTSAPRIGNPLLAGIPDSVPVHFSDDSDDDVPEIQLPRRRGRPPGSKNKTSTTATKSVNKVAKLTNLFKYTQIFDEWGFDDDECEFNARVLCSEDAPAPVKKLVDMLTGGSGNNDFGFGVGVGLAVGMYAFKRAGKINDVRNGLAKRNKQNSPIRFDRNAEAPVGTNGNENISGVGNSGETNAANAASYVKSPKDKVAGIFGLS